MCACCTPFSRKTHDCVFQIARKDGRFTSYCNLSIIIMCRSLMGGMLALMGALVVVSMFRTVYSAHIQENGELLKKGWRDAHLGGDPSCSRPVMLWICLLAGYVCVGMSLSKIMGLGSEDFLVDDSEFDDISKGVLHGHVQYSVTVTQV